MRQIFTYILAAILLIAVAFVAFYVFIALLVVGVGIYAFVAIRRWLIMKGVVNAPGNTSAFSDGIETPERPRDGQYATKVTVIEAEFETVEPSQPQDRP
jgi:hypothetical protein